MRNLFISILFLLFWILAYSQNNDFSFKHLSNINGLSQNWVRCIYQDDYGFMWFGTADGLNCYDGNEFKVYRPQTANFTDIGDINVSSIKRKSTNELWVATDLGVYIFNYKDDKLYPFNEIKPQTVLSIIEDKKHNIWIGTSNGLICYNPQNKTKQEYYHIPRDNSSLSDNYINTLFEDSYSNIWIGTKGGLNVYLTSEKKFKWFKPTGVYSENFTNDILSICEDKYQRLWIGYSQDGLYYFKNNPNANVTFKKLLEGKIISLLVDKQNRLWIGKGSSEGLWNLALNNSEVQDCKGIRQFRNDPQNNKSLSDNSIYSIYQDSFNDIWIGTFGEGVNYYSERHKKFYTVKAGNIPNSINHNLVNAIIEDDKSIYIATDGGLNVLDKKTNKFKLFKHELKNKQSISSDAVYALCKDRKGNIWAGTWLGGLNLYNPKNDTFTHFMPDGKPGSLSNANVFSVFEDSKGYIWVGTIGGGLNRYDPKTGKFKWYKNDKNDPNSLYYDLVNCIYETHDGQLYISVYNSLELYDYKNDNFIHYKHDFKDTTTNYGNITSIFEDSHNSLWIATNSGLEYFDKTNKSFTAYTMKDGLPDNTIQSILEDDNGNLWISTNKGLSKFVHGISKPENPKFINYTRDDGLSGNEFKKRSAFKNSSGVMYFGSSQGYTYFHPDSIRLNSIPPKAILSGFSTLKSKPGSTNKSDHLNQNINLIDKITLTYRNADFVIKYAALNYLNPQYNRFKYKLEGYDADWVDAGSKQSATYTNIDPGKYTFWVIASNNDGIWCVEAKKIDIIILPPWWQTVFFKIVFILFIILIVVLLYWLRFRVVEKQKIRLEKIISLRTGELKSMNHLLEQRQEEIEIQNEELSRHRNNLEILIEERTKELELAKEKAEESDMLKSAFLANMSHEIRTPMNAIVGFASLLNNENLDNESKIMYIDTINKNSESLLVLIDDILDISLIESNQLKLVPQKFDACELLDELERNYSLNKGKNIEIKFIKNGKLNIYTDPIRFRQIFNNLITNAIKYTEKGFIHFGFEKNNEYIQFYVKDSGLGISPENHEKIFNHFYKVDHGGERLFRGTGIGLSICKRLVEMMGGNIGVKSILNSGSTFYFNLPRDIVIEQVIDKPKIDQNYKLFDTKIIVAEDESDNFKLIERILSPYNIKILWAKNGVEVIDLVKNECSDNCVVLMDIKMPIMDGVTATQEIRKINNSVPIIAVTAYAQPNNKNIFNNVTFSDYISKPYKPDVLLSTISKFISS